MNRRLDPPFLVSAIRNPWVWVEHPSRQGIVRAGVRSDFDPGIVFRDIVLASYRRGLEFEYGNSASFSLKGMQAVIRHVDYYLKTETDNRPLGERVEVLAPVHSKLAKAGTVRCDGQTVLVHPVPWLHGRIAVAVPLDRAFLGDLYLVGPGHYSYVVHNSSRALGVAHDPVAESTPSDT